MTCVLLKNPDLDPETRTQLEVELAGRPCQTFDHYCNVLDGGVCALQHRMIQLLTERARRRAEPPIVTERWD